MVDETKENSSPIDASDNLGDEDFAAPVKRMKLNAVEEIGECMITSKNMDQIQFESDKHEECNTSSTQRHDSRDRDEIIILSEDGDNEMNSTVSNDLSPSKRISSNKKKKLNDTERAEREKERLRRNEERRIKAEKLLAAKELRLRKKEERAALAEQKRMEKEKAMREKEEQRKLAQEKKKAEEEAKKQKEKEREQRKKEEEEKKEQRRKEEEERRERRKRELEAAELRKKRESDRFLSFFSKVERPVITYAASATEGPALPFEVKEGMILAPVQRRPPLSPNSYERLLDMPFERPYLSNLPRRTVIRRGEMRAKLFQFHDNYRPPYYGTFRKRSTIVRGRRPFARDTEMLDYEVDSDEEWEEEPEGEDCDDENNRSDESEASDEENDGFFVEHGYLSGDEGSGNEEVRETHDDDAERLRRLKAVAEDWKNSIQERSTKKKLIPTLYGPVFGQANASA
uniref:Chromatin assembly factor 1 subunit A n=1 Tax=Parascaris univalens TaxID=6257 RepID=A0A915ANX1_PARUN